MKFDYTERMWARFDALPDELRMTILSYYFPSKRINRACRALFDKYVGKGTICIAPCLVEVVQDRGYGDDSDEEDGRTFGQPSSSKKAGRIRLFPAQRSPETWWQDRAIVVPIRSELQILENLHVLGYGGKCFGTLDRREFAPMCVVPPVLQDVGMCWHRGDVVVALTEVCECVNGGTYRWEEEERTYRGEYPGDEAIATMHVLTPSRHSTHAITRNMFHYIHGKNFILRTKRLRFDCGISRGNVCLQIREELDPYERRGRSPPAASLQIMFRAGAFSNVTAAEGPPMKNSAPLDADTVMRGGKMLFVLGRHWDTIRGEYTVEYQDYWATDTIIRATILHI